MFHVFHIGGTPRLAVPDGALAAKLAALGAYQPVTLKKWIFRLGITTLLALRLDRLAGARVTNPLVDAPEFNFEGWLAQVAAALRCDVRCALVVWPPYAGRVYVHLNDAHGRPAGFTKILTTPDKRRPLLIEAEMLRRLALAPPGKSISPQVLNAGCVNECDYLIVSPMPRRARPVHPTWHDVESVVADYAGPPRMMMPAELRQLGWWRALMAKSQSMPGFMRVFNDAAADGLRVCRVHGDFNWHNMAAVGNQLWLIDWEFSDENGPAQTDRFCFWVMRNRKLAWRDPRAAIRRLRDEFGISDSPAPLSEMSAALGYLAAVGSPIALHLARHFQMCQIGGVNSEIFG